MVRPYGTCLVIPIGEFLWPVYFTSYPSPSTSRFGFLSSLFHFDGSGLNAALSSSKMGGFSTNSKDTPRCEPWEQLAVQTQAAAVAWQAASRLCSTATGSLFVPASLLDVRPPASAGRLTL